MTEYKVIGLERRNKLLLGLVLKNSDKKQEVYTEEGEKVAIPAKKIVWSSNIFLEADNQKSMKNGLQDCLQQVEEEVDIVTLWEFMEQEEELEFRDMVEIYFGEYLDKNGLKLFKSLKEDNVYFKNTNGTFVKHPPENVQANRRRLEQEARRKQLDQKFTKWFQGYHAQAKREGMMDDEEMKQMLEGVVEYALKGEERASTEAKRVAGLVGNNPDELLITLENKCVIEKNINEVIHRANLATNFSIEELAEAEKLAQEQPDLEGRELIKDCWNLAIDSEDTEEVDDAISFSEEDGMQVVGVHIADVDATVPEGSRFDKIAEERFATLYFPDGRVPVFPMSLVSNRLSLEVGQLRPTLSAFFYFDEQGELLDYKFARTAFQLARRATYEDTAGEIGQEPELQKLHILTEKLRQQRQAKGAIVTNFPDVKIVFDEQGEVDLKLTLQDTPGHQIVSELMILFNGKFGQELQKRELPGIFRCQPPGTFPEELSEEDPIYPLKIRWSLSPASLSLTPGSHATLGLDVYSQATSPIRRYSDLVLHRQLFYSKEGKPLYNQEVLQQKLHIYEKSEKTLKVAENDRRSFWFYRYLKSQKNKVYKGYISRIFEHSSRIMVFVPELWQEFPLRMDNIKEAREGKQIFLKVQGASPRKKRVHLSQIDLGSICQ